MYFETGLRDFAVARSLDLSLYTGTHGVGCHLCRHHYHCCCHDRDYSTYHPHCHHLPLIFTILELIHLAY